MMVIEKKRWGATTNFFFGFQERRRQAIAVGVCLSVGVSTNH